MSNKRYILLILVVAIYGTLMVYYGYFLGRSTAYRQFPNCQEDEFIYPTKGFEGPGKNEFSDYNCVSIDNEVNKEARTIIDRILEAYNTEHGTNLVVK